MAQGSHTFDIEVYAHIVPALPPEIVVQIADHEIAFHVIAPEHDTPSHFVGAMDVDILGTFAKASLSISESEPDLDTIRNSIMNFMEKLLNTFNFMQCRYHSLHLEGMLVKRNKELVEKRDYSNYPGWDALEAVTQEARAIDALFLLNMQASDVQCARAINDLRHAIANHYDTAFYSYRAIESIKAVFIRSDDSTNINDAQVWDEMRSQLRISRQFIMAIKETADLQRHGRNTLVLAEDRLEAMRRAWLIVGRYLQYCLKGRQGLGADFELLE